MRSVILTLFAMVALAADGLAAVWLVRGLAENGAVASTAAPFPLIPGWSPGIAEVLLLHLAVVTFGTFCAATAISSPTARDATALWFLFLSLSIPLPGVGLAIATIAALALMTTKRSGPKDSLFTIGTPLADPITGRIENRSDSESYRSVTPLTSRIRGADISDLRSLAIGLRGLPSTRTTPVLERLQRDPDTYLQLYSQGGLAEANESEEAQLRTLQNHIDQNPGDQNTRLSLAAHLVHLAAAPEVATDQRSQMLGRALTLLGGSYPSHRQLALRTKIAIQKGETEIAEGTLDELQKSSATDLVTKRETAALRAELLHLSRRWQDLRPTFGIQNSPTIPNSPPSVHSSPSPNKPTFATTSHRRPRHPAVKSKKPEADVCLILEGTYPYVSGGVSTWVHQVISELPDHTFSILFIGAERDPEAEYRYEVPNNVLKIEEFYIADPEPASLLGVGGGRALRRASDAVRKIFADPSALGDPKLAIDSLRAAARAMPSSTLWKRRETWDLFAELLQIHLPDASCIDTFWTARDLTTLLWKVLDAVETVPDAKVYHSVCTGYAGILASLAAGDRDRPFLLSEHGIYVKERVAEIYRSAWIPEPPQRGGLDGNLGTLKRLWVGFFEILARIAYEAADEIISLFGANAEVQSRFGADPTRIRIIPNGITPEKFDTIRTARENRLADERDTRPVVGFLGRVVSIKDVKTFLRAAAIVLRSRPDAIFRIIGPTGEEPDYHAECIALHSQLGLGDSVEFTGQKSLGEALPGIDLMVLTSLSEGLPFVILEAYGTGIPVVATDVGSCRELIEGRAGDTFGPGGIITPVGKPEKTAAAILAILNDPAAARQMGEAGRGRAAAHYTSAEVFSEYGELYKSLIAHPDKATRDRKARSAA